MSKFRRTLRNLSVAAATAAALTITLPPGLAHAINEVPADECIDRDDLLKIWYHGPFIPRNRPNLLCLANEGRYSFDLRRKLGAIWVQRISTGNNDIEYEDANGDRVHISRWTHRTLEAPANVLAVTILPVRRSELRPLDPEEADSGQVDSGKIR